MAFYMLRKNKCQLLDLKHGIQIGWLDEDIRIYEGCDQIRETSTSCIMDSPKLPNSFCWKENVEY